MTFSINRFQPKTFAIKLSEPSEAIKANLPSSFPVDLNYNIDLMSYDTRKNNATYGVEFAYPAELLADNITSDGINFSMGSRKDGDRNAIMCLGQQLSLPPSALSKKLYLLAASGNKNGTSASLIVDGITHAFHIPYYAGRVGIWETEYNMGSEFRKENIAFAATHRHNVLENRNDAYDMMYMYKYCIEIPDGASSITLPDNRDVYLFSLTLSDNENDDIKVATPIQSLPEYKDLSPTPGDCNLRLNPISTAASHQNGQHEGPEKAVDNDLNSKWCVTNNDTPWLELTFEEPVEICSWHIFNAGIESANYITSDCRLQKFENGQWINVDIVTNNTFNKLYRSVEPFKTTKVRLQIDKGEQNGSTTRILEFAVFGKEDFSSSIVHPVTNDNAFIIRGNYPNPFKKHTTIECQVPNNVKQLNLQVYNLTGAVLYNHQYPVIPVNGVCQIEWNNTNIQSGVYLYSISAIDDKNRLLSDYNKLVIK